MFYLYSACLHLFLRFPCREGGSSTVNQSLSSVGLSIALGGFQDDEGNTSNPITNNPYGPGDINPYYNTPVFFVAQTATSIGQANPLVPAGILPGGVAAGTSDGSSAQANGTVDVTPTGFTINNSSIGLNNSGLWQPGVAVPGNATGPPSPGQLGIYLDAGGLIPTEYAVATVNCAVCPAIVWSTDPRCWRRVQRCGSSVDVEQRDTGRIPCWSVADNDQRDVAFDSRDSHSCRYVYAKWRPRDAEHPLESDPVYQRVGSAPWYLC